MVQMNYQFEKREKERGKFRGFVVRFFVEIIYLRDKEKFEGKQTKERKSVRHQPEKKDLFFMKKNLYK